MNHLEKDREESVATDLLKTSVQLPQQRIAYTVHPATDSAQRRAADNALSRQTCVPVELREVVLVAASRFPVVELVVGVRILRTIIFTFIDETDYHPTVSERYLSTLLAVIDTFHTAPLRQTGQT